MNPKPKVPVIQGEKTALVCYMPMKKTVVVADESYEFVPRRGVSLSWVNNNHVQQVLGVTRKCCGGSQSRLFRLANQAQVDVWET